MATISIIVPVYNVEKYLRECIDSILAQTFADFELILVDDGSPDNCGKICDEYAEKDGRIVVVHKENGGLSSARNAGLDIAKGEYIGFVDSGDYIAADMYEMLYEKLVDNNTDMSTCGFYNCYSDGSIVCDKASEIGVVDNITALRMLLDQSNDSMGQSPCNKLYKRNIFDDLRYPVGKVSEDLYVIVDIMLKTSTIYIDATPKYYYLHREGSIVHSGFSEADFDRIKACKRNIELTDGLCPQISIFARCHLYAAYMVVLNKIAIIPRGEREPYKSEIKEAMSAIRGNLWFVLNQPSFTKIF